MDWYPSILEWCGVEKGKTQLDGHSLQPIIDSADEPTRHPVIYFQWQKKWAVREGDWKLLDGKSLRNLSDPEPEVKDYAAEKPEVVKVLQARYDAWAGEVFGAGE
jgi:arylsulfatase A-like enzyme